MRILSSAFIRSLVISCGATVLASPTFGQTTVGDEPGVSSGQSSRRDDPALHERARAALGKAVEFYRTKVATEGGYHFAYAADLSFGRSEMSEGPTRIEIQREGTPLVGMAYLDAYEATRDRYYLDAATEVARALVKGQYCSGGWDYYIEFEPQKRNQYPYRAAGPCTATRPERQTTLDDNITQAAMRVLMRVDRDLGFKDAAIHEAALFALDNLVKAQYPNGAWPQRFSRFPDPAAFPVKPANYPESWSRTWPGPNYTTHYTFNDNSVVDMIDAMLEAARIYKEPRYLAAAEKGGAFILLAQMPAPQPGWAQQYDRDMHPAWARRFEPPSITGGESQSVMRALLLLYRETGNRKYLEPLPRALEYYRRSGLPAVDNPSEIRRRACPSTSLGAGRTGAPCMARFYELKTNRPLYITKGTRVSALDQGATNVDGYEVSYNDTSVITHYAVLVSGAAFEEIEREYREVLKADPTSLRRPDRLRGLSPWNGSESPVGSGIDAERRGTAQLDTRVRAILDAMDARGAWVEEGTIGKANRLVSVFAAKDLVVTLGGKVLPMKENDTLEVFAGADPPNERIIRTRTFVDNIAALSDYLARRQGGQPLQGPIFAQTGESQAAMKVTTARLPDGRPDLQGIWGFATVTPLQRPKEFADKDTLTPEEKANLEEKAVREQFVDRPPPPGNPGAYNKFWSDSGTTVVATNRTSLIVDPPDGRVPPLTPHGKAREAALEAKAKIAAGPEDLTTWDRCILGFNAGPPMIGGGYNAYVQLFQTPDYVAILNEMVHDARIIPLDGRPSLSSNIRQWRGDSRGRWNGDTLVIETRNFRSEGTGTLSLRGLGLSGDEHLHLIERFRRLDTDTLLYEYTIDDPTIWTRSWTVSMTMRRSNQLIYEYACHEGNYGLSGILAGARAEEKAATAR